MSAKPAETQPDLLLREPVTAETLIAALGVGDPIARPYLANGLRRCLSVEWLTGFLDADVSSLRSELEPQVKLEKLENIRGLGELGPARAFLDVRLEAPLYVENLRALLLLGFLNSGKKAISKEVLGRLTTLITGLFRKPDHPLRRGLIRLESAKTAEEAVAVFRDTFREDDPSDRAKDFRRIWIPLLLDLLESRRPPNPRPSAGPTENPTARPTERTRRPREQGSARPRVTTIHRQRPSQRGIDPVVAEVETTATAIAMEPTELPDSERYEVFFAERAGRRANSQLIDGHIDALTDSEAVTLVKALLEEPPEPSTPAETAARTTTLLMLATGCTIDDLQQMEVTLQAPVLDRFRLVLDLHSGCLWRPILFDRAPVAEDIRLDHWIQIPLAPPLLKRLSHLNRAGWMADLGENPAPQIRAFLASLGLSTRNHSLGRIRHWLSVAIQKAGGDLAATMLLCGDTFARSSAPLHYYAPRHSSLEAIFRSAVWPIFGEADTGGAPTLRDQRVGFAHLVPDGIAVDAMRSLRIDDLPPDPPNGRTASAVYAHHNRFCNEVIGHFVLITSHRPTDAIERIRRDDLSLDDGLAILSDKRVDAAHWFRAAAMSPSLCAHLGHYLNHLDTLSGNHEIEAEARNAAGAALGSRDGLFFHLNVDGQRVPLKIACWKSELPASWDDLAPNWYRCYLSMTLRELGVPASSVLMQMGHLEAADYPLSRSSPFRLLGWCADIRPYLEKVSDRVSMTFKAARAVELPVVPLDAIDWNRRLRLRSRGMERIQDAMQRQFRRVTRQRRDELTDEVLKIIGRHRSDLKTALEARTGSKRDGSSEESPTLGDAEFAAIVEDVENHSDDPLISLALRFDLSKQLRRARKFLHWVTPRYTAVALARGADATPLFPQMMLARRQMLDLRRIWVECAALRIPGARQAHVALGLLIWGPMLNRDRVGEIMSAVGQGFRVPGMPDLVLLPGTGQAETVRAYAGLVASQLREGSASESAATAIDWTVLGHEIASLLPESFNAHGERVIDQIIAIAQVNAILEQSPLGRLASERRYCRAAGAVEQAAFLTGAFLPPPKAKVEIPAAALEAESQVIPEPAPSSDAIHKRVKAEHLALKSIVRLQAGEHKTFPLTGVTIKADRIVQQGQAAILQELDAFRSKGCSSVIEGLVLFIQDLIRNGTVMREDPSLATVRTYLGSVAKRLVDKFRDANLSTLDPEDIVDRYNEMLIEASGRPWAQAAPKGTPGKRIKSHARVGSQLLAFHKVVVRDLGVPPIDVNELLIDDEDLPEDGLEGGATGFATVGEYQAARQLMAKWADKTDTPPDLRRLIRAAAIQTILMYRGGLRINESTCLMLDDLIPDETSAAVVVRNNGFRTMKNPLRKRLVPLRNLTEAELQELHEWRTQQQALLSVNRQPKGGLFTKALDVRSVYSQAQIRMVITGALEATSGRHLWPHLLRHSAVCRAFHDTYASSQGRSPSPAPRDIRRMGDGFGHVLIITTLGYFHFPWLLQFWQPALPARISDRQALAALSGRSKAANDKALQRCPSGESPVAALQALCWPMQKQAAAPAAVIDSPIPIKIQKRDTVGELDRRLQLLVSMKSYASSEQTLGLTMDESDRILAAARWLKEEVGYDVLSARLPRISELEKRGFPIKLRPLDDPGLHVLSDWFIAWYRADDVRRYGGIRCPAAQAELAKRMLIELGCDPALLRVDPVKHKDRARAAQLTVSHPQDTRTLTSNLSRLLAVTSISRRVHAPPEETIH